MCSEHCSPAVSAWINEISPPGIQSLVSPVSADRQAGFTSAMANNLEWLAIKLNTPLRKKQTFLLTIRKIKGILQKNDCACQIWFNIFNVINMLWKGKSVSAPQQEQMFAWDNWTSVSKIFLCWAFFYRCLRVQCFFHCAGWIMGCKHPTVHKDRTLHSHTVV